MLNLWMDLGEAERATMGGSNGGKHSKGKGTSKSRKYESSLKKFEVQTSKHDLAEILYDKARGQRGSKGKCSKPQIPGAVNFTEKELERYLLQKLDVVYTSAKNWLLASGYGRFDIERAILNNGHADGPKDVVSNILTNAVSFLEQKVKAKGEAFKDTKELYIAMLETLVNSEWDRQPEMEKKDVMWLVLVSQWGSVPSASTPFHLLSGDGINDSVMDGSQGSTSHSCNEGTSVPDLSSTTAKDGGSTFNKKQDVPNAGSALPPTVDSSGENPKDALIVDLMKTIKNLKEKVKAQKEWALKTVIDSAKRLNRDLLELNTLRMEKKYTPCMKDEKLDDKLCTANLEETEKSYRSVICEARYIDHLIKALEVNNARIKADTAALMLSVSEYGNNLNPVIHREMRCTKRLATLGKHTSNLKAKVDEEKQKVLRLQLDVLQAEKEAMEAEEKWKQEIKEKEQTLALLTEEKRRAGTRGAIQRAELARLRQQMETERKLKKAEVQRLEEELSRLRVFMQTSNVSLEGDTFLYNGVEIASLEPSATYEHSRHCMLCCTNAVSVVFLPCTHQVLCAQCFEASCNSSGSGRCPYCGAEIQRSIKTFGPT